MVIRKLDGGGMTDLYVARDPRQRRVVIRTPKEQYARNRSLLKSFAESARVLGHLHHPNIVQCLEVGRANGKPFVVLDYAEAQTVRDLIRTRSRFLSDNALSLLRQIAAALHCIHHRGYLHLDIKPENLLVQEDGHVLLIDFDLARPRRSRPYTVRNLPGTPSYLPPEALARHQVDERVDIYSFGVTAYEMLTLHKPYAAETAQEHTRAQLSMEGTPIPMRSFNPAVPEALENVIFKCLAKNPDSRYPATSLIIKDLEAII
jgi:serine/threonine-protein kinase